MSGAPEVVIFLSAPALNGESGLRMTGGIQAVASPACTACVGEYRLMDEDECFRHCHSQDAARVHALLVNERHSL